MLMNKLDQIYSESLSINDYSKSYIDYLTSVLNSISLSDIEKFIKVLLESRERASSVFFIGNGGSAATASHFANDIAIGSRSWDQPYRATAFTDNVPVITAIGNDYGYEDVFLLQLKINAVPGDLLVQRPVRRRDVEERFEPAVRREREAQRGRDDHEAQGRRDADSEGDRLPERRDAPA